MDFKRILLVNAIVFFWYGVGRS